MSPNPRKREKKDPVEVKTTVSIDEAKRAPGMRVRRFFFSCGGQENLADSDTVMLDTELDGTVGFSIIGPSEDAYAGSAVAGIGVRQQDECSIFYFSRHFPIFLSQYWYYFLGRCDTRRPCHGTAPENQDQVVFHCMETRAGIPQTTTFRAVSVIRRTPLDTPCLFCSALLLASLSLPAGRE